MKKKLLSSSLILLMSVGISSAQLVTNGSFETVAGNTCDPNGAGCTPCFYCGVGTTFSGWMASDVDLFVTGANGTNLVSGVPDGQYALDLNGRGPGSISQVITGLTPGQSYTLAFKYTNNDFGANCKQDKPFQITIWDATTDIQLYTSSVSTAGLSTVNNIWADFNYSEISPSSSVKIEFKSLFGLTSPAAPVAGCGFGGGGNNSGASYTIYGPILDFISVTPTVLPITLVSFGGTYTGANLNLNWKTENEENISKMVVQFYNGTSWQDIGSVKANGIGLSNNYGITIPASAVNSIAQVNLRLKVVSLDNTLSYSKIIGLNNSLGAIKLSISPNPSKNGISFVRGLKGGETISVYNTLGQRFITKIATSTVETIDLSSFAKGVYNVSIVNKDGKIINNRLVKD